MVRPAIRGFLRAISLPAIALAVLPVAPTKADTLGVDFTSIQRARRLRTVDVAVGYVFDVINPIQVNGLGMWDYQGNGFFDPAGNALSHEVGLWDPYGNLIAQSTVSNADPLTGVWRFHNLTGGPVTLGAGAGYTVAAITNHDYFGSQDQGSGPPPGWTVDPNISWIKNRLDWDANSLATVNYLEFETDPYPDYGIYGGNIRIAQNVPAVPEPGFVQLPLLIGMAGVGAYVRRRRAR